MKIGLSRTALFATEGVILIAAGFAVFYLLSGGDLTSIQFLKQKASSGYENTQDSPDVEKQTTPADEVKPQESTPPAEIADNSNETVDEENSKETTVSSEIKEASSSSESAQTE